MPLWSMTVGAPIRQVLSEDVLSEFEAACQRAIMTRQPQRCFSPNLESLDSVTITPVLANDTDDVRFLVCWAKESKSRRKPCPRWEDFATSNLIFRYRLVAKGQTHSVEVAPWYVDESGEYAIWEQEESVAAVGAAPEIMGLLVDAAFRLAAHPDLEARVQIAVPSVQWTARLLGSVVTAMRATRVDPDLVTFVVAVEMLADEAVRSLLMHARAMGFHIDMRGLGEFTQALYQVGEVQGVPAIDSASSNFEAASGWHDDAREALRARVSL